MAVVVVVLECAASAGAVVFAPFESCSATSDYIKSKHYLSTISVVQCGTDHIVSVAPSQPFYYGLNSFRVFRFFCEHVQYTFKRSELVFRSL